MGLTRVVLWAPGGFIVGYLLGRAVGRAVSGCPWLGPCNDAVPTLLAIPTAVVGMGVGGGLAASRVGGWIEGLFVWTVGIFSMLTLVVAVGLLGVDSLPGRILPIGWLLAAVGSAAATQWPSRLDDNSSKEG